MSIFQDFQVRSLFYRNLVLIEYKILRGTCVVVCMVVAKGFKSLLKTFWTVLLTKEKIYYSTKLFTDITKQSGIVSVGEK